jgi:hypothetical protein
MNTQDDRKEGKPLPSNSNDVSSVLSQSLIPISMMLSEAAKVDVLITIGRLLLTPALVISSLVVLASLPIVRAWSRYHPQPGQTQIAPAPSHDDEQPYDTSEASSGLRASNAPGSHASSILTGPEERIDLAAARSARKP